MFFRSESLSFTCERHSKSPRSQGFLTCYLGLLDLCTSV
jgi:hypothetical protein